MEPVFAPLVTEVSLTLRNFIGVVGESVVNAAAVNIKVFAVVLAADSRTLNVPAGIANAPRTFPLKLLRVKF